VRVPLDRDRSVSRWAADDRSAGETVGIIDPMTGLSAWRAIGLPRRARSVDNETLAQPWEAAANPGVGPMDGQEEFRAGKSFLQLVWSQF